MKKGKQFLALTLFLIMAVFSGVFQDQTDAAVQKTTISLNQKKYTLEVGKTFKLKASVKPAKKKVVFKSSNKKIASVSVKGVVTGKKKGKATITAKVAEGGKKATCKITVVPAKATDQGQAQENKITNFRTQQLLDSHYVKHGAEFGNITKEQYLAAANKLLNSSGANILKKTEPDGDILIYNTDTNEFLVLSYDGFIRTYFKPSDGIDYFNRQ
ncbi:MAG: Ig-like domain-containing protein [Roseburia sp.]|nr:Ig-like domain-containing protein [Roseburia sp.]